MRTNIRDRKGSGQVEELAFMSAAELSQEIRLKRIAPTDVIEYFIKRIEQRNPSINAMVSTNFEHALQQARLLEADLAAGRPVGVFAGVPTAMKDFLPGKPGWHGTCGGIKALYQGFDTVLSIMSLGTELVCKTELGAYDNSINNTILKSR